MRGIVVFLVSGFLLSPNFSFAGAVEGCSRTGYTIATVNGVFTDDDHAKQNMRALKEFFDESYKGEKLKFEYFPNPSHLGGLGDIYKAIEQKLFDNETVEDYDLVEMLRDATEKVTTLSPSCHSYIPTNVGMTGGETCYVIMTLPRPRLLIRLPLERKEQ